MSQNEKNPNELDAKALDEAVGGALTLASLATVGGTSGQTENGDGTKKLYKVGYDGGTSEDWGPSFVAR